MQKSGTAIDPGHALRLLTDTQPIGRLDSILVGLLCCPAAVMDWRYVASLLLLDMSGVWLRSHVELDHPQHLFLSMRSIVQSQGLHMLSFLAQIC